MFKDAFTKLTRAETETVLADINPTLDGSPFNPASTTILAHDLPFWAGHRLLDIADYNITPAPQRFVVHQKGRATVLDGTNNPVYALNQTVPVALNDNNISLYARFFFTYVRGKHGRFTVVESVDDIPWRDEPPPAARKAMSRLIDPLLVHKAADGGFDLSVSLLFRGALFKNTVHIAPSGQVNIGREELLIEDMPVLDDIFGQ